MENENQIVDLLYKKIGGLSFTIDAPSEDGTFLGGRVQKRRIRHYIRNGGLASILKLLIPDPALLKGYGTEKIRKEIDRIAKAKPSNGVELSTAISTALRRNVK